MGIFKRVHELAEGELDKERSIKKMLRKTQMQLDLGLLTETEFKKKEETLVKELSRIYQQKRLGLKEPKSVKKRI